MCVREVCTCVRLGHAFAPLRGRPFHRPLPHSPPPSHTAPRPPPQHGFRPPQAPAGGRLSERGGPRRCGGCRRRRQRQEASAEPAWGTIRWRSRHCRRQRDRSGSLRGQHPCVCRVVVARRCGVGALRRAGHQLLERFCRPPTHSMLTLSPSSRSLAGVLRETTEDILTSLGEDAPRLATSLKDAQDAADVVRWLGVRAGLSCVEGLSSDRATYHTRASLPSSLAAACCGQGPLQDRPCAGGHSGGWRCTRRRARCSASWAWQVGEPRSR